MDTSMNATAVLFNLYLLYLIKYYSTTFEVKLYPILLSIDCSLDLLLAISAFLAQPVVFTANGYYVAFSNGFFTGRSAWLDCFFISVFCFFLHANIIWIPVQFVYRYRLFSPELSKSSKVNLLIVTVALAYSTVATVVIVDFFRIFEDTQEIGQHILDMNGWPMESAVDKHLVVYYIVSNMSGDYVNGPCVVLHVHHWVSTMPGANFHLNDYSAHIDHRTQSNHNATLLPLLPTSRSPFFPFADHFRPL
ncbi:serpentine type 7TM GPCR chemoreceptor str domain-containing protein [Ditylenchus destructor]|uniref:Serpentine type 7TM GPCR chemoreceptor str domain-containing protein n=1 Tax=Ditylenchus destructor TaxID=166010 RepID=A0AAD4QXZ2_9BILA|nr:serpentine type 7TM GPCR chemoreceptor str domain-containing protein [Ditylenchus destructor]